MTRPRNRHCAGGAPSSATEPPVYTDDDGPRGGVARDARRPRHSRVQPTDEVQGPDGAGVLASPCRPRLSTRLVPSILRSVRPGGRRRAHMQQRQERGGVLRRVQRVERAAYRRLPVQRLDLERLAGRPVGTRTPVLAQGAAIRCHRVSQSLPRLLAEPESARRTANRGRNAPGTRPARGKPRTPPQRATGSAGCRCRTPRTARCPRPRR